MPPPSAVGSSRLVSSGRAVRRGLVNYVGVGGMLALLVAYFSYTQPRFATYENMLLILEGSAVLLIVSLGLTFVLLTGMFDLSIGGVLVLSGVLMALMVKDGFSVGLSIAVVLVGAVLFGAIVNGLSIAKLGLSFFVVTLGTLTATRGFALVATEGQTQDLYSVSFLRTLGSGRVGDIPWSVILALSLLLVSLFVTRYTGFGRMLYAIGGNPEAAALAGINVTAVRVAVFAVCAALAALGGVVDAGRLGAAAPDAQLGIELTAAAAVLLGGTSFHGGSGGMFSTFIGVAFLGVLANGLTISGVSSFWTPVITGTVLFLAVSLDLVRERSLLGRHVFRRGREISPPEAVSEQAPPH